MNKINDEIQKNSTVGGGSGGKCVVLDQPLDLSDFDTIYKFIDEIKMKYCNADQNDGRRRTIDVLINNAGRNSHGKGTQNLDIMFQSNYLGHFLLTIECIKQDLITKQSGKIINLSSVMHHFVGPSSSNNRSNSSSDSSYDKLSDPEFWKSIAYYKDSKANKDDDGPLPECYSASKLGAILFTNELNKRYSNKNSETNNYGIRSIAVNPGSVASDIWRDFPMFIRYVFKLVYLTTKQGSTTSVAAAVIDDWPSTNKINNNKNNDNNNNNSNNNNNNVDSVSYLQPYWLPSKDDGSPPFPAQGKKISLQRREKKNI